MQFLATDNGSFEDLSPINKDCVSLEDGNNRKDMNHSSFVSSRFYELRSNRTSTVAMTCGQVLRIALEPYERSCDDMREERILHTSLHVKARSCVHETKAERRAQGEQVQCKTQEPPRQGLPKRRRPNENLDRRSMWTSSETILPSFLGDADLPCWLCVENPPLI